MLPTYQLYTHRKGYQADAHNQDEQQLEQMPSFLQHNAKKNKQS